MKEIQEIYQDRRRENEIKLEKRKREIYSQFPEIKKIKKEITKKNIERISSSLEGNSVSKLTDEIKSLINRRNEIFEKNNIPHDYLKLQYHCDICKDTGIVGTENCQCWKSLKVLKLQEDSHIQKIIEEQNFKNFDLNVFRKSIQGNEKISPYENMKEIKQEFESYAKNFSAYSANIYIFGKVGTGKTYMLNCIAKEVLDLQYSVIYMSESELINTILEHKFAYSSDKTELKPKIDAIFNCDLLIIDDLGANAVNENTKAALLEVINSRLVKKLPVVISSNLEPENFAIKYDARLYSRIMGQYFIKKFYGNDIRMLP